MGSDASASIIHDLFVCLNKFNTRKTSAHKWSTMAASKLTPCTAEFQIILPELTFMAHIFPPYHATNQESNYKVIFGRDLLQERGINLDF